MPVTVRSVAPDSAADETGFEPGTVIKTINGIPVRDAVDFLYLSDDPDLVFECESLDGEQWCAEIELDDGEDLGIDLVPDKVRVCKNKCVFCFVDQMPKGMRKTLYIKDDDWRTSFLHGSYVTLTNLTDEDIERIITQHISPLYVSVHASDDAVRSMLLGNHTDKSSFELIRRLAKAGISMHTQAVVCEGLNDGEVLTRTIEDLYALRPATLSLSVVPVGLTQFRDGLYPVQPISPENARAMLDGIHALQDKYLRQCGTRFVFAADELYLRAGIPVPDAEAYEDFPQLENGVGLVADFVSGARSAISELKSLPVRSQKVRIGCLCAKGIYPVLADLAARIESELGVDMELLAVENRFFGPTVNVSGLLTGADVIAAAKDKDWDVMLLPQVMFRDAKDATLDGVSIKEIGEKTGIACVATESGGEGYIRQVWEMAGKEV